MGSTGAFQIMILKDSEDPDEVDKHESFGTARTTQALMPCNAKLYLPRHGAMQCPIRSLAVLCLVC